MKRKNAATLKSNHRFLTKRWLTAVCTTRTLKRCEQSGNWGSDLYWKYNSSNNTLTISKTETSTGLMTDNAYPYDIPWYSFCSQITKVVIESGVTSIASYAFYNCYSLTEIEVDSSNPNYASDSGVLFNKEKTTLICYPAGKTGAYSIPPGITCIGDYTFYGCGRLTSVTLPESITSIGNWAFSYCCRLVSITIPTAVTSIGNNAFYGCGKLTSIILPTGITSIGSSVFFGCRRLASITLPESITSIGNWGFSYCCRLASITLPESITSIGDAAFYGCGKLTSITLPAGITSIGNSVFFGCGKLTSITFPKGIASIGSSVLYGCGKLTSITFPEGIASIGSSVLYGCRRLKDIYSLRATPPSVGSDTFSGLSTKTCVLHIPAGSKQAYSTANAWKEFPSIKEDAPSGITNPARDGIA